MEITITPSELYLFAWAAIATGAAIYWSNKSDHYKEQFQIMMKLACVMTKDEEVRRDFETNVANKLME